VALLVIGAAAPTGPWAKFGLFIYSPLIYLWQPTARPRCPLPAPCVLRLRLRLLAHDNTTRGFQGGGRPRPLALHPGVV